MGEDGLPRGETRGGRSDGALAGAAWDALLNNGVVANVRREGSLDERSAATKQDKTRLKTDRPTETGETPD